MRRIPDIVIERVLLGEATSEQRARVLADPAAKARLAELEAANDAFLEAHPPREVVGEIQRKVHVARTRDTVQRHRDRWTLAGTALAVGLAVTLVIMAVPSGDGPTGALEAPIVDGIEQTTVKGPTEILVYRRVDGRTRTILPGVVLRERDQLRLGYRRGRAEHGMLLSIDGRGAVTLHAPDDGDTLLSDGRVLLAHAYELDDAPDFERFFFVTAPEAFDVQTVMHAAEELAHSDDARKAALALPDGFDQKDFLILKDVL